MNSTKSSRNTGRFGKFCLLFYFACSLILVGCSSDKPPPGLDQFAKDFKAANKASSIEPMLQLYYLDGADERTIELLRGALNYELGLPIAEIRFEPLTGAPEETIDFTYKGVAYGPSLPPSHRMRVIYDVEDRFTSLFTIGQSAEGQWHIVCAKPKPDLDF